MTLFSHLVTHRLEVQPAFPNLLVDNSTETETAAPGALRFSVESLNGDDYWLREAWTAFFKPHLDTLAMPLTEILAARLADAHRVLRGVGQASEQFDEQSFHRRAIALDAQNSIPWPSDVLVEGLRDCVEFLASTTPDQAASVIDRLERSDVPLLRRIALHGWAVRADVSDDEKLSHLVASGNLYAFATKRETYRLIELAAPASASDAREGLLQAACEGPPVGHSSADEAIDAQQTLTLLSWIAQFLPDFPAAGTAFEQFQVAHSDLLPSEHPGYDGWSGPSGFATSYPFPVEEVLKCRTAAEVDLLIGKSAAADPLTSAMWAFRALDAIADAASQDLAWAQDILADLAEKTSWTSQYWTAILSGVSRAAPQADHGGLLSLASLLAGVVQHAMSASEGGQVLPRIAELLMAVVRRPEVTSEVLDATEAVGAGVVEKMHLGPSDFIAGEPQELLDRAMNNWTGWITRFWVDAISHRRKLAGDSWAGLSGGTKHSLGQLIDAPYPYNIYPQAMLAANFTFINDVDEAWATERVRPLFAWADDHDRAARAWSSFLAGAPWNERISTALNSDLRLSFGELHDELGKVLAGRFAQLIVQTSSNIHGDGTLARFIATADEEVRTDFARHVSWLLLHQVTPGYAESQWPHWMEHYLSERLADRPLSLTPSEAGQMLGWVITAGSHFPEAVSSYIRTDARFSEFHGLFNEIKKRNVAQQYPDQFAQLLRYVLERSDSSSFFVCSDVEELLHEIIPTVMVGGRDTLLAICEAAARLQCPDALTWKVEIETLWPADGGMSGS